MKNVLFAVFNKIFSKKQVGKERKSSASVSNVVIPLYDWEEIVRREHKRIEELACEGIITAGDYEKFYKNIQTKVRLHMGSWYYDPVEPITSR